MSQRIRVILDRLSEHFRARRFQAIEQIIARFLLSQESVSILDVGGRATYWRFLPMELRPRVSITIVNSDLELDRYDLAGNNSLRITNVPGDGCSMPQYADGAFDLVHSNSVIEHLGSYRRMMSFAREVRRIGRAYYVQTPNFWFPVDPHYAFPFVHWLPDPVRARLFSTVRIGLAQPTSYVGALTRMEDCRMVSRSLIKALFPDGVHRCERILGAFAKSLIVSRVTHACWPTSPASRDCA